jgi:hypothetical protein
MTTWHTDDSLEEALWFAVVSAYPAPPYHLDCTSRVCVAIGNPAWATQIASFLSDLNSLRRAVGLPTSRH